MLYTQEDTKIEVDVKVRLTKTQLSVIKKFTELDNSTSNETSLKALIMAIARESIKKSTY